MSITLQEFLAELDAHGDQLPLEALKDALGRVELSDDDLNRCAHFSDEAYQRNLIHTGPAYEALLLCWRPGQRTPIHDHRGSACGVKVIQGTVTETVFKHRPNGWVYATESHDLSAGGVCGSNDMDTHQLSNLSETDTLITMHIYSPPLERMGVYSIEDNHVQIIDSPRDAPVIVS